MAQLSNRKFIFLWMPSLDCNAYFHELFDHPDEDDEYFTVLSRQLAALTIDEFVYVFDSKVASLNQSFIVIEKGEFFESTIDLLEEHPIILAHYNGLRTFEGVPCQYFGSMLSKFYRLLRPVPEVQSIVDNLMNSHFQEKMMIGVHIRVDGEQFDWPVIPPGFLSTSAEQKSINVDDAYSTGFGDSSVVRHFLPAMIDILNHHTDVNSLVTFFIASNSLEAKEYLLEKVPSIAVMEPLVGDRSSMEGIRIALVEWLMLSRSSLILHTYGSSFAVEASRLRSVPIVGIWNGYLLYHSSNYLPDCGCVGYQQASQPSASSAYYYEQPGEKPVETRTVSWRPCKLLAGWGFSQFVYCGTKG